MIQDFHGGLTNFERIASRKLHCIVQCETATLDLTAQCWMVLMVGQDSGDGEVLMDLGDGFPKFVANQSVGAKVWILHNAAADKIIKIWLAIFFMGCLGEMKDGFQPKIAQETRYPLPF